MFLIAGFIIGAIVSEIVKKIANLFYSLMGTLIRVTFKKIFSLMTYPFERYKLNKLSLERLSNIDNKSDEQSEYWRIVFKQENKEKLFKSEKEFLNNYESKYENRKISKEDISKIEINPKVQEIIKDYHQKINKNI